MFKTIVKIPTGFDANLHKLDLFLPYNILAYKNGKQYDFSIELMDLKGIPDCKIGDFGNNVWYRPKKAQNEKFEGYQSYSTLSKAVKMCLIKHGFDIVGWYERDY